jgi:hypothetical protein
MGITNSVEYNAANYMDAAFAPIKLANKQAVYKATWGHLAPKRNRTYQGYIVFTISAFGDMVVVDADFAGLPDSPWLFDAVNEFAFEDEKLVHGAVYKFVGTFRNYRFDGTREVLYMPRPVEN